MAKKAEDKKQFNKEYGYERHIENTHDLQPWASKDNIQIPNNCLRSGQQSLAIRHYLLSLQISYGQPGITVAIELLDSQQIKTS